MNLAPEATEVSLPLVGRGVKVLGWSQTYSRSGHLLLVLSLPPSNHVGGMFPPRGRCTRSFVPSHHSLSSHLRGSLPHFLQIPTHY